LSSGLDKVSQRSSDIIIKAISSHFIIVLLCKACFDHVAERLAAALKAKLTLAFDGDQNQLGLNFHNAGWCNDQTIKGVSIRVLHVLLSLTRVVCFFLHAVLKKAELEQLLQKAIVYTNQRRGQSQFSDAKSTWITRNKPKYYFDRIMAQKGDSNGLMTVYLKDPSGDLRCPINGEIDGVFFLASPRRKRGQPHNQLPFGGSRLLVRTQKVLSLTPNIYFADFSCLNNNRKFHHVTLVLTQTGSDADIFCREHLPRLSLTDGRQRNPFLFVDAGGQLTACRAVFVDVFFTEDLNIGALRRGLEMELRDGMNVIGPGTTTQGGLVKSRNCPHCDLFCSRQVANNIAGLTVF